MKSFADLAALHKCFCNYLTPRHYSIACRKLVSIRKPLWKKPELHTAQAKTDQLIPFFTDLYALDVRNNMAEIGSEGMVT